MVFQHSLGRREERVRNTKANTRDRCTCTVICEGLRTRHDFQALLCYESDYLISCFYFIVQFRLKKNISKERGREKRFKTRHDFEAFLCYGSYYLISCFYCIIQFGFKKNIKKERRRFREHVREEEKFTKTNRKHKETTTTNSTLYF